MIFIVVLAIMVGMLLTLLSLLFMFFRQGFHCSKGYAALPQRKDCSESGGDDYVLDSIITADDGR